MTDKEEFILSELKRLQREIDLLKEVYAHYLEEGLKREELVEDAMMEEVIETNSEQLEEDIAHSNGAVEKIELALEQGYAIASGPFIRTKASNLSDGSLGRLTPPSQSLTSLARTLR